MFDLTSVPVFFGEVVVERHFVNHVFFLFLGPQFFHRMKTYRYPLLLLLSCAFIFSSCDNTEPEPEPEPAAPTVVTAAAQKVLSFSATLTGSIKADGGSEITELGMCWSTTSNPTTDDNTLVHRGGIGTFTVFLVDLEPSTTYFARAYATNSMGTSYGNEITFTTASRPLKIYTGDVVLKTQEEVDVFGAEHYNVVTGSVLIGDYDVATNYITSLASLSDLMRVGGQLTIYNNNALATLEGLNGLTTVEMGLNLAYLPLVTEIDALSGVTEINGSSAFFNMEGLLDIDGLSNVISLGTLSISSCSALNSVDGLSGVTKLNSLFLVGNPSLTNIDGLRNVTTIEGELYITGNAALQTLAPLNKLTIVKKNVLIDNNNMLSDLEGFNSLRLVGRELRIQNNSALVNIEALGSLVSIGSLMQEGGGGPQGGSLWIENNDALLSLDGLQKLSEVAMQVEIWYNGSLRNYCSLQFLLTSNLHGPYCQIIGNAYNPTSDNIKQGEDCSQ
jgi:hypothetical protein